MTKTLLALATSLGCLGFAGCRTNEIQHDYRADSANEPSMSSRNYREEGPDGAEAEEQFRATASGLRYRILRRGNGTFPSAYDRVRVSYRGWLSDGTVFDSSYERGKPATFMLSDVVPGWTEGLQLVSKGGKIELEIPSRLGYGAEGKPPVIPPGATLKFIVELHDIY
jgi:FKBP-type peptidyl-prolyl cis-trans isomerase FkpA